MIVTVADLDSLRRKVNAEGKKVVFASGSFDMTHGNHFRYLENAKKQGDVLIVGVKSDAAVRLKAANRPIYAEQMRAYIVDNSKPVDYTVIVPYDEQMKTSIPADNTEQQQWLTMFEPLVAVLRPDVWYHEDAPKLQSARNRLFAKYGVHGIPASRGNGASTTQIINRIMTGKGEPIGM